MITVRPGPPEAIELTSDPPWVRGNKKATVFATVVDEYGNGVPSQPVEFELVSGAGTLTPVEPATDAGGVARAEFLSPRKPEIGLVRATSNALSTDLALETALVDPDEASGTVTSYPNPFHPDEAPTTVAYKLAADARVTLSIWSLMGAEVLRQEISESAPGGREGLNEFQWDGRNGRGRLVASGGYLLVVEAVRQGETIHVMRRRIAVVR